MARPLRIEYEGAFYHVTCRGNERKKIFLSTTDKEKFLEYLDSFHHIYQYKIHTWCIMDNHYHLLIETAFPNISKIMQRLNTSYTTYFNIKRKRIGHLLGGRPKILLVEKDEYALQLSRYIHLNPVRAHMVERPEYYAWSSYTYFVENNPPPAYLETAFLLRYFGDKDKISRKGMKDFVEEGIDKEIKNPCSNAVKGTLLGSQGFIDWVKKTFVNHIEDEREIAEIKKLKKIDPKKMRHIVERNIGERDKMTQKIEIYLLRKYCDSTLKEIGKEYGNIGISGIGHIVRRLEKRREEDTYLDERIKRIETLIMSNGQA